MADAAQRLSYPGVYIGKRQAASVGLCLMKITIIPVAQAA
jgi:hypothetical protein